MSVPHEADDKWEQKSDQTDEERSEMTEAERKMWVKVHAKMDEWAELGVIFHLQQI